MPPPTNSAAVARALLGSAANLPQAVGGKTRSTERGGMRDLGHAMLLSHRFCPGSWSNAKRFGHRFILPGHRC